MSPRTQKQFEDIREEKRELILNSALKLFADKGFYATSISALADEAGISKGLVYNYFESKEEILVQLFNRFIELVSRLLNPDSDEEITNEEMELFFRNFTASMNSDREYWMLYFQLSMQKSVLELIQRNILKGEMFVRYQQLTYKFFADRFPDPMPQMLFFSFLIKGFSIQYVLTPEFIPVDEIGRFWNRVKEVFIVDKLPVAEQV